jgi:DNA-directed RNA polymerase subunit M/transcription elongation factor TFIIS
LHYSAGDANMQLESGKVRRVVGPECGSEVLHVRRVAMEGEWPDWMLTRRYRCRRCGATWRTVEVPEELTPPCSSTEP